MGVRGVVDVFRDESRPGLIEHWFYRRVVVHRVAHRNLNKIQAFGGMWIGVSECGVMTREPIPGSADVAVWCLTCFPERASPPRTAP